MKFMNGFMAIMEDIDNDTPGDESEVLEATVDVANDAAEINAADIEITSETTAAVDAAGTATDELIAVSDGAQKAIESGEGLSEDAAEMASIAVESIRNRLQFRADRPRLVPATETFGNSNTRLMSTKMVVESISDTIKQIWTNIKNFALRLWEKIKLFFTSVFKSVGGLEKIATALKARINNIPTNFVKKEKELKSTTLGRFFSVKGKVSPETIKELKKNLSGLVTVAKEVGEKERGMANFINSHVVNQPEKLMEGLMAMSEDNGTHYHSVLGRAFTSQTANLKFKNNDVSSKPGKGKESNKTSFGPFPNNVVFTMTTKEFDIAGKKYTSASFGWEDASEKVSDTVPALDSGSMLDMTNEALSAVAVLRDLDKNKSSMDGLTKEVVKMSENVMATAAKLGEAKADAKTNQAFGELRRAVSDNLKFMSTFGQKPAAMNFAFIKNTLDYVSLSLKNMGAPK